MMDQNNAYRDTVIIIDDDSTTEKPVYQHQRQRVNEFPRVTTWILLHGKKLHGKKVIIGANLRSQAASGLPYAVQSYFVSS